MTNIHLANIENVRSEAAVRNMLRDIGYVLWLGRKLADDIRTEAKVERRIPQRPMMSDFCATSLPLAHATPPASTNVGGTLGML